MAYLCICRFCCQEAVQCFGSCAMRCVTTCSQAQWCVLIQLWLWHEGCRTAYYMMILHPDVKQCRLAALAASMSCALQTIVDDALDLTAKEGFNPEHVVVYDHKIAMPRSDVPFKEGRDKWWQDNINDQPSECEVEWMDAEAPLFKVLQFVLIVQAVPSRLASELVMHAAHTVCDRPWTGIWRLSGWMQRRPSSRYFTLWYCWGSALQTS